jgi:hypothetical protein
MSGAPMNVASFLLDRDRYICRVPAGAALWQVWDTHRWAALEGYQSESEAQVQSWAHRMSDAYRRALALPGPEVA